MWPILLGLGLVGGLLKLAYDQKEEPTIKPALRKAKLLRLARIPRKKMTLAHAEDGAVLAREFKMPKLENEFKVIINQLKKRRST